MIVKIFLSSSLKLKDERNAFIEAFKAEEDEYVHFEVYAHEKNGVMRIVSGADSQQAINAAMVDYDAFITYAGDRIGTATVDELLHELDSAKSLFKFIYVLHQPGLMTEAMTGPGYMDWNEFYERHMHDGMIKYYETELDTLVAPIDKPGERHAECLNNIREKARAIARELRSKTIVELYPGMLTYDKVISTGQSNYRLALDFYFRRSVDDKILEALTSDSQSPLVIVSGTSLAGKTRAVTEALKALPKDTHIHILQFDERAACNLAFIKPELQFCREFRNIFFVDDLHSLFDTEPNAPRQFMELCRFAAANPGRLRIIATSIISADDILAPMRRLSTGDAWLRYCTGIEIGALQRQEVVQMVRQLRRKGKFDAIGEIKTDTADIPLGALFINLDRMHNSYDDALRRDYMLSLVFDAIKTFWLWKIKSRSDIGLLLDFINTAYADVLDENLKRGELIALLRLIPEFVMLTGGFKPNMAIEEVLVDEVFRFEVSGTVDQALDRIIRYIKLSDKPLKGFTKLVDRLGRSKYAPMADSVVDRVSTLFPVSQLVELSEIEPSMGEIPLDWVATWRASVARTLLCRNDSDGVCAMLPGKMTSADPSYHFLLAVIIADEKRRTGISHTALGLLDTSGMPLPEYLMGPSMDLYKELIGCLPFDVALQCFAKTDFYKFAKNTVAAGSDDDHLMNKTGLFISLAMNRILAMAESSEQVGKVIDAFEMLNSRLSRGVVTCSAEIYFRLVYSATWMAVSRNIPEANIPLLFNHVLAVVIPDGHPDKSALTMAKAVCLNGMIGAMDEYDIRMAWKAMGHLRDNFTLTLVLRRMPDFPAAKGFVDEYLESESGCDANVNIAVLNALLTSCKTESDLKECQDLFVKFGLLAPDGCLGDIDDEYTQGSLLSSKILSYEEMQKLMLRHVDPTCPRDIRTLGPIVDNAPDYPTARRILFDQDVEFVSPEEQEIMRSSGLVVSWLVEKVATPHEAADAWRVIDDVWSGEKSGRYLEPMLCHPDANMLSAVVKNRVMCRHTADAIDFLNRVKADFPNLPSILRPMCNIAERRLEDEYPATTDDTIAFVNQLIVDNLNSDIKMLCRLVKDRFYRQPSPGRNSPCPDYRGIFPMVDLDLHISIREAHSLEFALNMLQHGWMHPYMLHDIISYVLNNDSDTESRLSQIILYAKKWKISLDHKAYIDLRDIITRRGIKIDLLPLSRSYSIIKELTKRLHSDNPNIRPLTVRAAFAKIHDYEARIGCRIYLSQRFMNAVVKGLTMEKRAYFDHVIDKIKEHLPDYFEYNGYVLYFLAHLIRQPVHFNSLRKLMPEEPMEDGLYEALVSAMSKCRDAERLDIAQMVFEELEISLSAGISVKPSYILSILNYTGRFDLRQAVEFIGAHGLKITGTRFEIHYLMQMVRTKADYEYVLMLAPKEWEPQTKTAILTGLVYAMYDRSARSVRADVLDRFNTNSMVRQLHAFAADDYKGELLKSVGNIYQAIEDCNAPEAQDFFDFWEDVGGFRL